MSNNFENILASPIGKLKGIGSVRQKLFNKLNIISINDLIHHYPRDYQDRSKLVNMQDLQNGEDAAFVAKVISNVKEIRYKGNMTIQKLEIQDENSKAWVVWFNQPYLKSIFRIGESYFFYGVIKKMKNTIEIQNPIYEKINYCHDDIKIYYQDQIDNKLNEQLNKIAVIMPIYSTTSKLNQTIIRNAIKDSFKLIKEQRATALPEGSSKLLEGEMLDYMPRYIKEKYNLADYFYSLQNIHFPEDDEALGISRYRLVFQELFLLQLGLLRIKKTISENRRGIVFKKSKKAYELLASLPYKLTDAQLRVFNEINTDMTNGNIMNRLVQGDVGSGKTIVAILALLQTVENGYQGAFMAPTGILAEQHYETIKNILSDFDIKVGLLTGSMKVKEKTEILEEIKNGTINIIIGTHALIQDPVEYYNLGLVITDEQHRFGVRQRATLSKKGENPHILIMTATPIPRTLALILYGDLDISIIDEMPSGRKKIETYLVNNSWRQRINNFIRKNVEQGSQVYIICPLIEDSEEIEARSTITLAEDIASKDFKDLKVGLLHGKLKPDLKDSIMKQFVQGKIDILVSTTVVEVGVDVPNATVMIIENAERFGLAQLHQLRGRVGRGRQQSYCILYNESQSKISKERMKVMVENNDGFVISEKDLELRGPGEFFGIRQHGIPELKIANLYQDIDILEKAQTAAKNILIQDPELIKPEHIALKHLVSVLFQERLESEEYSI